MAKDSYWGELTPGSDTALAAGCICAVMDNNHGMWSPWPPDGWWITEGCPVHHFNEKQVTDE